MRMSGWSESDTSKPSEDHERATQEVEPSRRGRQSSLVAKPGPPLTQDAPPPGFKLADNSLCFVSCVQRKFLFLAAKSILVKSTFTFCCLVGKSCPTLSDPMDCSLPGSFLCLWDCSINLYQLLKKKRKEHSLNYLAVQWLGLGAFTAGTPHSSPSRGTKILQATAKKKKIIHLFLSPGVSYNRPTLPFQLATREWPSHW